MGLNEAAKTRSERAAGTSAFDSQRLHHARRQHIWSNAYLCEGTVPVGVLDSLGVHRRLSLSGLPSRGTFLRESAPQVCPLLVPCVISAPFDYAAGGRFRAGFSASCPLTTGIQVSLLPYPQETLAAVV